MSFPGSAVKACRGPWFISGHEVMVRWACGGEVRRCMWDVLFCLWVVVCEGIVGRSEFCVLFFFMIYVKLFYSYLDGSSSTR